MRLVTAEQMKQAEEKLCSVLDMTMGELMEQAGEHVALNALNVMELRGKETGMVLIIAGRGNNGGDAFVAARYLNEMDVNVLVLLAGDAGDLKGDARVNYEKLEEAGVRSLEFPSPEDWQRLLSNPLPCDVILDGLLGTGGSGPARGPAASAIEFINQQAQRAFIISIDVPSGLNADTGEASGPVVKADITLAIGLPKTGLVLKQAAQYVGELLVLDIGFPSVLAEQFESAVDAELIQVGDLRNRLPRRERMSHKGTYGHVLIIAGARGYSGAATLAARGALVSGAGLVTVLVPESIEGILAISTPEIMVRGMPENDTGSHTFSWWNEWRSTLDEYDALLVGPGMTRHNDTLLLTRQIIRDCRIPLVLDADAISVFAGQPHWMEKASCPLVLTPHPGEFSTLFGQDIKAVQEDRLGVARAAAKFTRATVVLKGAQTVVAPPDGPSRINPHGNPGLATGGTGDVLAGMITSLLGQGMKAADAACMAVFVHGLAGDTAAASRGQLSLTASDVLRDIPNAFQSIFPR